jgi:hypothetical protein
MRFIRGLFALALLLVLAAGLWLYRGRLESLLPESVRPPVAATREAPTEALADHAQTKLNRLRGSDDARVALSAAELESLLLFRHAGLLPGFVDSPTVELENERFELRARLPVDRLPAREVLGSAADLLPDTVPVTLSGRLFPLDDRRSAVVVEGMEVADLPLPRRFVPAVLDRLGRTDEEGLPADAVAMPLPPGARAAYVRGDSLILVARAAARGS